jgi:hypothetical protein
LGTRGISGNVENADIEGDEGNAGHARRGGSLRLSDFAEVGGKAVRHGGGVLPVKTATKRSGDKSGTLIIAGLNTLPHFLIVHDVWLEKDDWAAVEPIGE